MLGKPRRFWLEAAERASRAFLVAFLAVWTGPLLAGGVGSVRDLLDLALVDKAAVAGLAAVGSLVLSVLGGSVGNRGTPALLPASSDPATPPPVSPAGGPDPLP